MKILIVHASAGYGHKKIAEVLADGFRARGLRENELEVVDGLDFTPWIFKGISYQPLASMTLLEIPGPKMKQHKSDRENSKGPKTSFENPFFGNLGSAVNKLHEERQHDRTAHSGQPQK
jgi:hypothetical protein